MVSSFDALTACDKTDGRTDTQPVTKSRKKCYALLDYKTGRGAGDIGQACRRSSD